MGIKAFARGDFHHNSQVHYRHPVGDVFHHVQIVGDEQIGEPQFLLEPVQEVHHLGLNGYVQGAGGFIAHDEFGVYRQSSGDTYALSLAPGEFVRIAVGMFLSEPHHLQKFLYPPEACFSRGQVVDVNAFRNGISYGHPGIQGGVGILKYHLGFPGEFSQLPFA